jgi:hypothetical protein
MDTLELSIARAARCAWRWLAAGTLFLGAGACAGLEPSEEPGGGNVDQLAERLVLTAKERADLRQIRVWVAEIRETRSQPTVPTANGMPADLIGVRLEHELVIALATRLNVVESELLEPGLVTTARAALGESAAQRGATHVLVGDYVRQRDAIQITLRLVDADSRLIVAAARGSVKLSEIGLMGFDRWAANGQDRGTLMIPGTATRTKVSQLSPEPSAAVSEAPAPATAKVLAPPTAKAPAAATAKAPAPAAAKAPDRAGATAPEAKLVPIPANAQPTPAPPAASTSSPSRAWPIEDFESWRQRRMAEQASGASQTVESLDAAARASTDPAVRARRNELANRPEEDAEQFPWRRNPWLARLLGVPAADR